METKYKSIIELNLNERSLPNGMQRETSVELSTKVAEGHDVSTKYNLSLDLPPIVFESNEEDTASLQDFADKVKNDIKAVINANYKVYGVTVSSVIMDPEMFKPVAYMTAYLDIDMSK